MADVNYQFYNGEGILFPRVRPFFVDGECFFGRFREQIPASAKDGVLGIGKTGKVYLVEDTLIGRMLALWLPNKPAWQDDSEREEVLAEVGTAMNLIHPNIVRLHDYYEDAGSWAIAMDYAGPETAGSSFAERTEVRRLRSKGPHPLDRIQAWLAQLFDAVDYAHNENHVFHGGIRPGKVLFGSSDALDKVLLSGFGMMNWRRRSRGEMRSGLISPATNCAADIFGIGATIYEWVTGVDPYTNGKNTGFVSMQDRLKFSHRPTNASPPESWEKAVKSCLEINPADRPQSIRELAAALEIPLRFESAARSQILPSVIPVRRELPTAISDAPKGMAGTSDANIPVPEPGGTIPDHEIVERLSIAESQVMQFHAELKEARKQYFEAMRIHDELEGRNGALKEQLVVEKSRQRASLGPTLFALAGIAAAGLGVGLAWQWLVPHRAEFILTDEELNYLPKSVNNMANSTVPFSLIEKFARAIGTDPKQMNVDRTPDGGARGITGVVALNLCNWLTEQMHERGTIDASLGYSPPNLQQLRSQVMSPGTVEWSRDWAKDGQNLKLLRAPGGESDEYSAHVSVRPPNGTFRIALIKID